MITKIHLQKDAVILSANGEGLGSLERIVLNPDENIITDVVVRIGNLLKHEEKVVPIEYVAETYEGLILLQDTAGDLKNFPPFEEEHVVEKQSKDDSPFLDENVSPVVMGYPVAGSPMMQILTDRVVTRIEQNIPSGTVAMKAGATVLDTDGKHVGHVEQVLAEPTNDQIKQMLISSGVVNKEIKLIPIKWVMKVDEETVRLRVDKTTVENLVEELVAE